VLLVSGTTLIRVMSNLRTDMSSDVSVR
jgi:hypothetical protein